MTISFPTFASWGAVMSPYAFCSNNSHLQQESNGGPALKAALWEKALTASKTGKDTSK